MFAAYCIWYISLSHSSGLTKILTTNMDFPNMLALCLDDCRSRPIVRPKIKKENVTVRLDTI